MAEKTLYDVLEVSSSASTDSIEAAYQRLIAKLDPAKEGNAGNPDARFQLDAVKQAYLTLGNTEKRAQYDKKLEMRSTAAMQYVEVVEPFWTLPKMIVVAIVVLGIGGFYYSHQKEQARLEAEKVIAAAKAKEAEEKARAEAEAARAAVQQEREARSAEATTRRAEMAARRQQENDVRQFQRDTRSNEITGRALSSFDRAQAQREESLKRSEEARLKREEIQAAAASRQQLARDRAELCRMERERYGKTISC